ncbi:MAG: hypothetical protein NVSMB23_29730 [Myxococcales bacterium]
MTLSRFAGLSLALAALWSSQALARSKKSDKPAEQVTCADGSSSNGGRGACSGHGGVAKPGGAAPAAAGSGRRAPAATGPAAKDAPAQVTCTDGSSSKGGRGACRGHGGIAKAGEPAMPRATQAPAPSTTPAPAPRAAPSAAQSPAAPVARTTQEPPASAPASGSPRTEGVNADAAGATARCKDGTFSHSKHHSGSCSGHAGVAEFLDGSKK